METQLIYQGQDITVCFDYQPYEPPSKDGEYPGCPEEYVIEDVLFNYQSIYFSLKNEELKEIEELLKEQHEEQHLQYLINKKEK